MEQGEFTEKVITKLLLAIPGFYQIYGKEEMCDVKISSNKRSLSIWVQTEDMEITIGLSGERSSGWHMHLNRFEECILDEEIDKAILFIQSVLNDERVILYSNIYGFTLNSSDYVLKHKKPDEIIESRSSSEV